MNADAGRAAAEVLRQADRLARAEAQYRIAKWVLLGAFVVQTVAIVGAMVALAHILAH